MAEPAVDKRVWSTNAGDYKILEEIGQGVSATVYRALNLPFNEVVAIKSLDLEKCNSNLDEIRRECSTLSLINHPSVVKACCSFVVDQSLWVVMPFMQGGSCLHIMKAAFPEGFDEPVIATILKEALKALEYLHRHGHIHRDIKAGNILMDQNGVVKLADFGVSAFMFDLGDRQRKRETFVGTPCWMAPEVMEQLHGYDFRADIWSFGITALELAHGHAPFSKYPPMKVLLMTLQNAPPGLDQERDKRFSKAFKEMAAMCLVKDPSKRPTAEKLLKHSFFKGAKTADYLVKHVLDGLPPLGDRVRRVKELEAARVAQKLGDQEQKSQDEYKRGVSSWNFNVDDLKAQAAMMDDEDDDQSKLSRSQRTSEQDEVVLQVPASPSAPISITSLKAESVKDASGSNMVTRVRSGPLPAPAQTKFVAEGTSRSGPLPAARKEPKHIGRFDVFDEDVSMSPDYRPGRQVMEAQGDRRSINSGPLDPVRVLSGTVSSRFSQADDAAVTPGGSAAASGDEPKPRGGPIVQKKGRFSVTSEDVDLVEDVPSSARAAPTARLMQSNTMAKSASVPDVSVDRRTSQQGLPQAPPPSGGMGMAGGQGGTVPVASIIPHLQNLMHHAAVQQDVMMSLVSSITSGDPSAMRGSVGGRSNLSRSGSMTTSDIGAFDLSVDRERERELLSQVAELQGRVATMAEEMQSLKLRNAQLERQLNAFHNMKEEERIQREELRDERP